MVIEDGDVLPFPGDGVGDGARETARGRWRRIEGEGAREGRQMLRKGDRARGEGARERAHERELEGRDRREKALER